MLRGLPSRKSRKGVDHLADLRKLFLRLRQYNLKMNPLKCFFGVSSGKLFGVIVRKNGIRVYPAKTKDILGMPNTTNIKELRGFQGWVAYIIRFLANR